MKELADFLVALGKLLAALNLPQAEPVTDCNRLPAAETVTDSHQLPEPQDAQDEPVGASDTLPAAEESAPAPKPKKTPWTCVCTCQKCGAEFRASRREAKCCPSCRSAIRREHMSRIRQEYLDKMQASAPAAPKQEDAGTEPAAGGE